MEEQVRYSKVTHYTTSAQEEPELIVNAKAVDVVQFNYSLRVRSAEKSLLRTCADRGVVVLINGPFESGALFRLAKGKVILPWIEEYDVQSWAQYILSHPAVTCVIPGTSNPEHVVDYMEQFSAYSVLNKQYKVVSY